MLGPMGRHSAGHILGPALVCSSSSTEAGPLASARAVPSPATSTQHFFKTGSKLTCHSLDLIFKTQKGTSTWKLIKSDIHDNESQLQNYTVELGGADAVGGSGSVSQVKRRNPKVNPKKREGTHKK